MKKTAFAAFIAFWTAAGSILSLSVLAPLATSAENTTSYTASEITQHALQDDCWMAIDGKVYDFSDYIPQHPAPPSIMVGWCGKEATEGMRTKGYGADHSAAAWEMMAPYQIGVLAEE